ncbi:hypothetical protein BJ170DRAFT_595427 [Xylariales sp. AK1849]|nr:hypothetical protein BJ170DRAFT_595427 [Xylariales sp. AK1849]
MVSHVTLQGRRTHLCGYLVNGTECHDLNCHDERDHDPARVNLWSLNVKAKQDCEWRTSCRHNNKGVCLYRHQADETRVDDILRRCMLKDMETHCSINPDTLTTVTPARINETLECSSFNRLADNEIAVPGVPARFHPLEQEVSIPQDSNNSALRYFPSYTYRFEPLLRSLELMKPDFNLFTADVVCNVGILDQLFKWLNYPSETQKRFDMEWLNDTLFISRWLEPKEFEFRYGRGGSYEQRTRKFEGKLHHSASHHRVHSYNFGGLKCVVQSEIDSYSCGCHTSPRAPKARKVKFSNMFDRLALDDTGDGNYSSGTVPTVKVRHVGRYIPLGCLLELKTRKLKRGFHDNPCWGAEAQLYFSQQTRLYTAFYHETKFRPGSVIKDKAEDLPIWEETEQQGLGRLVGLLNELIRLAKELAASQGVSKTAIVFDYDGVTRRLEHYRRRGGESFLPAV